MAISTNGVMLTRLTGALYNQQLSASTYSEILAGNTTAASLNAWANAAVAADFGTKTNLQVATTLITNVGLSSVAGLADWVAAQLTAGGTAKRGETIISLLNSYSNMDTTEAIYGASVATFNTKVDASQALSQTSGNTGGTYATVSAAIPVAAYTLLSGVDLKTTAAGDDVFTSVNTATSQTLNAGDNLNGGTGNDTLNITSTSALAAGTGFTSTGIESVAITATTGAFSLDTTTMSGITTVTNSGSNGADVTVSGLTAKVAVNLTGANANTTIAHAAAAVVGTADALALTLNGANTTTSGTLTANGFETVNVNAIGATGSSTTALTISDDSLQTLAITGAGASAITATLSGASGAVVGTVTGGDGAETLSITPGASALLSINTNAGNDRVNITSIAATHTIAGGDGTDTLSTPVSITTTTGANISGFETVRISAAGVTVALPATNTVGTFTVVDALGGTLTNLAAGGTVNLRDGGPAIVTNTTGWAGLTDAITVNVGAITSTGSTGSGTASSVSAALIETATINNLQASTDVSARTVGVSGTSLKTLNVVSTGSAPIVITGGGATAATSVLATVDASGVNGAVTNSATMISTAGFTLKTGAGADAISGGLFNDTLDGGAGNDTLTGSIGQDSLTGGLGADTYVFGANATNAIVSNQAAPDTVVGFVPGTDKLSITNVTAGPVAFLNNYATFSQGSAAALADGRAGLAFFVTGDTTLYVQAQAGTQSANDTAIFLPGVTALTGPDLLLGAQGTGSTISLTAASANLSTALSTNASGVATILDDVISSTAAFMIGSTINGGSGSDSLTISTVGTADLSLSTTLVSIESVSLTLGSGTTILTMPATASLAVTNASATAASVVILGGGTGQSFTASGSGANTVTSGAASQKMTGGTGADTFNTTPTFSLGASFNGGGTTGTTDTIAFTGTTTSTLAFTSAAPVSGTFGTGTTQITGIEAITLGGAANVLTITNDQAISITGGTGATTIAGTAGTGTISVVSAAGQAVNLSGTSNFAVSGMSTGVVTSTQTAGTLTVTSGAASATASVISSVPTTVTATTLSGAMSIGGVGDFTINGAGSIAVTVTELASHTTGSLTISNGTVAVLVTENSAGLGPVVINQSASGTTDITALVTHASHTYNLTNVGVLTTLAASTATAYSITTTSATAHTYVNSSTTSSVDTYIGSSSVDNVTLGLGADKFTTGGGADVFSIVASTLDTGQLAGFSTGAAAPVQGTAINVSTADVITVTPGADAWSIVVGFASDTAAVTATIAPLIVKNGALNIGANTTAQLVSLQGTYSSTTNLFTVDTAGVSTLLVYDDTGVVATGNYRGIVLVGYVDTGAADTWTGAHGAIDTMTYLVVL
jgi:hypothetical protein